MWPTEDTSGLLKIIGHKNVSDTVFDIIDLLPQYFTR